MEPPSGVQSIPETICLDHVVDPVLRRHVKGTVAEVRCSFCNRDDLTPFAVPMDVVIQEVFKVATWLYSGYEDASVYGGELYETELETNEVVGDCAAGAFEDDVSERVVDAIVGAIVTPTSWFSNGLQDQFAFNWEQFAETVKHESRFIYVASAARDGGDQEPPARLSRFLDGLLAYADKETRMLTTLPAGFILYRGRMTDDASGLRERIDEAPATELGSAPPDKADAGRMNAQGVPLFYAADKLQTAVAEIALHSPYDEAVIGGFKTQRPLTILDLTRKPRLPSLFDHAHRERFMFARFVADFVESITAPVILDGRQRIGYVPTQVVTEYLRWVPQRRIEGIAFPSRADSRGKNIVLFFGPGEAFQTVPATADELDTQRLSQRVGAWKGPALTLSRRAITEHAVTRRVRVKTL